MRLHPPLHRVSAGPHLSLCCRCRLLAEAVANLGRRTLELRHIPRGLVAPLQRPPGQPQRDSAGIRGRFQPLRESQLHRMQKARNKGGRLPMPTEQHLVLLVLSKTGPGPPSLPVGHLMLRFSKVLQGSLIISILTWPCPGPPLLSCPGQSAVRLQTRRVEPSPGSGCSACTTRRPPGPRSEGGDQDIRESAKVTPVRAEVCRGGQDIRESAREEAAAISVSGHSGQTTDLRSVLRASTHRIALAQVPHGQSFTDVGEHADLLDQVDLRLAGQACCRQVTRLVQRGTLGACRLGQWSRT